MRWTSLLTKSAHLVQTLGTLVLTVAATPMVTEVLCGWRWN
jgi:hypothetical protein